MTKTIIDTVAANELALYASNDSQLYFNSIKPVIENLAKKVAKGTYDGEKALKAWEHVARNTAMKYAKDFGTPGQPYYYMFNAATRREAAEILKGFYLEDVEG